MRRAIPILVAIVIAIMPVVGRAQGLLIDDRSDHLYYIPRPIIIRPYPPQPQPTPVPRPPQSYKIKQLSFQVNLTDQVAKVQVTQSFVNTGSVPMEVSFVFPLPYDGAVDRLTFMVDGKEYDAKLLDSGEARRVYESYIRRNQDPALLEWIGTGMFKTSVFPVPAGAERTVTLRYNQVCRKIGGLTEFLFPLSTAKYTSHAIETVSCQINVQSQTPLKNVYSPTHPIEIKRPGDKQAVVSFQTTNVIPTSDFRLMFDVGSDAVAANVLSYRPEGGDEGYFLLLVSPEIKKASDEVQKKNVVFVVDRSGSMSGKKMEQAKAALKFVLNNLREGDVFNIVAYDTEVESFRPEMQKFNDETRQAALGFVEGLYAGGSTNIDGALKTALGQLTDESRPNYVVFLTDGLPTAGVTGEAQIAGNAKERNKVRARMFVFGVGYDVNSRLLDKLARNGFGQSEYVRPNEDIEVHVSALYNRIGAPAMTNVALKIDVEGTAVEQGTAINRVYPKENYDLFAGDQLVVAGRYKRPGAAKVTIKGTVDKKEQSFSFPAQLIEKSNDESLAFIEKIWAMRRVGEIIDQIDLQGKNQELVDELVGLAKKHGIMTPYTAFLADDQVDLRRLADNRESASRALDHLRVEAGAGGVAQRAAKNDLQNAGSFRGLSVGGGAGGAPGAGGRNGSGPSSGGFGYGGGLGATYKSATDDKDVVVSTIQNVGRKAFFFKNSRWMDSSITEEQEKKVQKVQRFSTAYFALVERYGKDVAKYLAIEGPVTVVLDGQAYELTDEEPPK